MVELRGKSWVHLHKKSIFQRLTYKTSTDFQIN